jgi:hypothetical protein
MGSGTTAGFWGPQGSTGPASALGLPPALPASPDELLAELAWLVPGAPPAPLLLAVLLAPPVPLLVAVPAIGRPAPPHANPPHTTIPKETSAEPTPAAPR